MVDRWGSSVIEGVVITERRGELTWVYCVGLGDTMECSFSSLSSESASSGMSSMVGLSYGGPRGRSHT